MRPLSGEITHLLRHSRALGQRAIRLVENRTVLRRTPELVQSPRATAAPRDRPKLTAPAKHLLDLDRAFGHVNRDLMETRANVNEPLAPLRRTAQSRVPHAPP